MAHEREIESSGPWVARLAIGDALAAARLRTLKGVDVAADADQLWLRGNALTDALRRAVEEVGPVEFYRVDKEGLLIARDDRLPSARLPQIEWTPISLFFRPSLPRSVLAATISDRVILRLKPSAHARDANALLTTRQHLEEWIERAPDTRMRPLRYAVHAEQALVIGQPLPSLPGTRCYLTDGLCVPCGFELSPVADTGSLRAVLKLNDGEVALFDESGWHRIASEDFVQVSRSSVRLTFGGRSSP